MRSWGITCSLLLAIPHLFAFPIVRHSLYTPEYHLQAVLHFRRDVSIEPHAQAPLQGAQPTPAPAQTPHVEPTSGGPSPAIFILVGIVIAGALAAIGFLLFRCVSARRHVAPSAEFASPASQERFRTSWFSWSRRTTPPPSQRWKQRPTRAGSSFSRDMTISQIEGPPIVTAPPQSAYMVQPQTIMLQDPPPPPRRNNHGRVPSQPPVGENPFTDRNAVTLPPPPPPPPPPPLEPRPPPPIAPQMGPGAPYHEVIRPPPPPPPAPVVAPVVEPIRAPVPPPAPPPTRVAAPVPTVVPPIPPTPRVAEEAETMRQLERSPSPATLTGASTPSHTGPSRPVTPVAASTATTQRPQSILTRGTSATGTIRGPRPIANTPGAHRPTGPRPILRVNTLTPGEGEALATSVEPPPSGIPPPPKEPTERRVEFVSAEPPRKQEGGTASGHKKQDSLTIPSATAPASAAAVIPRDSSVSPALPNPPVTPTPPAYIPFSFAPESPVAGSSGNTTPAPKKRGPPAGIAKALASAMGYNHEEVQPPQTVAIIKRGLSAQAVAAKKRAVEEAEAAKEQAVTKRKYDSDDDVPRRSGFA